MKFHLLLSLVFLSLFAKAEKKPNVLLILADDLGFSDLSCYGGEIPTPNLDRLATGGAKFSSFYTSARCCPSRASLITGLHPHQAGIGSFTHSKQPAGKGLAYKGALLPTCATLAEMLLDDGYSTWMVGKWHMAEPGPIHRGFQNYYGYKNFLAHSEDQWDPSHYVRLPESVKPELPVKEDFYVTDVFTDYSLEFLKQARSDKQKPWFLYLAHSSPHFPIQAPKASIDRHLETYRKGWDVLRTERFERQKKLGLIRSDSKLPPLSEVPVDRDDIANGFSGKPNPNWSDLPADRREDLARRMATFAAMVEHIDLGIGRIITDLEKNGELDNTIIAFLADNGACYEWGPFGFDGRSRLGKTTLHTGDELAKVGQPGTHSSYGSGWANLGNTPLNMYKHFCHEGGIASPLILHWPKKIQPTGGYVKTPSHLMDIVPTILEATGAPYPAERNGHKITPVEGTSLLPALTDENAIPDRVLAFEHQAARGLRKGDWKLVWGKRQPDEITWELYNLAQDRSEQTNVAENYAVIKEQLVEDWNTWAKRVHAAPHILPEPGYKKNKAKASTNSPQINKRPITINATVSADNPHGVVLAQGGKEHGYSLHFIKGIPSLDVRVNGKVTRLSAREKATGEIKLLAKITSKQLSLTVDGKEVTTKSPGLIPVQPKDDLSIGRDDQTSAGNYEAPNTFNGKVLTHNIKTLRDSAPKGPGMVMANDWPQWLGPQRDGIWREAGIRKDLKGGPKVLWRTPVSWGYAGPAVAEGRVYVPDFVITDGEFDGNSQGGTPRTGMERILCLDAKTGEEIWKHEYEVTYTVSYPGGPRVTPTIQDGRLYFQGTMGHLRCLDAVTGDLFWKHDICAKYKCRPPRWGYASHPLVHGDLVYATAGGENQVLIAFNKKTGKEKWKALSSDEAGYCPPRVIRHAGVEQLLFWYPKAVVSLNPSDGTQYWSVDLSPVYSISRMVPRKLGNKLFVSGPGNEVAVMLELHDEKPEVKVLWRGEKNKAVYCLNSPPQMIDGVIYGVDSESSQLMAVSMENGDRIWTNTKTSLAPDAPKKSRHGSAFLVYHETNKQFWIFGETGDLILADLSREGYQELGRHHIVKPTNQAWGRKVVWSQPAFAMKSIFARNDQEIVRIDLSE